MRIIVCVCYTGRGQGKRVTMWVTAGRKWVRVTLLSSAPAPQRGGWGSNDVSKIRMFVYVCVCVCVNVVNQKQLLVKCTTLCRVCVGLSSLWGDTEHSLLRSYHIHYILLTRIAGSKSAAVSGRNMCPLALIVPLLFTSSTRTTAPNFLLWYQCWFSSLNARKHQ